MSLGAIDRFASRLSIDFMVIHCPAIRNWLSLLLVCAPSAIDNRRFRFIPFSDRFFRGCLISQEQPASRIATLEHRISNSRNTWAQRLRVRA
jgi:hypothetical protein